MLDLMLAGRRTGYSTRFVIPSTRPAGCPYSRFWDREITNLPHHCTPTANSATICPLPRPGPLISGTAARTRRFRKACHVEEIRNAFIGKSGQPSPEEISTALGPSAGAWNEFVAWMANKLGVAIQEWKGICVNKYGWSMRLKLKQRTIVYMGPCTGCFRVSFVLGDKALAAAKAARLPKKIQQALAEARRYPEGTGLWLVVKKAADLAPIRTLAEIKLAH